MTDSDSSAMVEPDFREILTPRLRLRTVRLDDAQDVMPMVTREDIMYWTSQGPVANIDQARTWLSARALGRGVFNFAVELRNPDDAGVAKPLPIIGLAGCIHAPEIGYMIHPDYAGKGYTTEAVKAILPQLFDHLPPASEGGTGFDHVEGWADVKNVASCRILEKCGFVHCETTTIDNPMRGSCELAIYRKARPDRTLKELGLLPSKHDEPAAPPPPIG